MDCATVSQQNRWTWIDPARVTVSTTLATANLIFFPVNLLHNAVHLLVGLLGLGAYFTGQTVTYTRGMTILFGILTIAGFLPQPLLGLVPLGGVDIPLAPQPHRWPGRGFAVSARQSGEAGRRPSVTSRPSESNQSGAQAPSLGIQNKDVTWSRWAEQAQVSAGMLSLNETGKRRPRCARGSGSGKRLASQRHSPKSFGTSSGYLGPELAAAIVAGGCQKLLPTAIGAPS